MNQIAKRIIPGWGLVVFLVLAGAAVRWWNLGKASIWHDEGFSIMMAQLPLSEILERTARDVHPPLYYMALHYWISVFGSSEVAVRSLSMVATLLIIPLTYCLVRRLWNERGAQLAAVFVCFGPMLVRYGQEARMYGLMAFLVLLTVYFLVRAMERNQARWWIGFSLSLAAAMYTHYYSVFIIPAVLVYVTLNTNRQKQSGWWNPRWWLSSLGALLLFAPWLPSAYGQVTRQKYFDWIPSADAATLPNTLLQFLAYGYPPTLSMAIKLAIGGMFIGLMVLAWKAAGRQRTNLLVFGVYALAGPVLVYAASLSGSPYLERYFIYAAVGFYILLALMITTLGRRSQLAVAIYVLVLFGVGSYNIHTQYTHDMRSAAAYIQQQYQPGDYLLSDVLLTYFDFSYYNQTGAPAHVWQEGGVNGYGESSLIYTKADEVVVRRLETIQPASGRVWLISKLDKQGSVAKVPVHWTAAGPKRIFGDNAVQQYLMAPRGQK
ncbi:MAG TPA: glycosyltransferase family 39 protein [Candidatus Saccharimonadia bacterium]